jgi:FixJ family two-component response regulator
MRPVSRPDNFLSGHDKTARGLRPNSVPPASLRPSPEVSRETIRIMPQAVIAIIDDDPFFGETLETLTAALGYRTELYESAEEFIQGANFSKAECLLVDIQLGDISGIELVRHLAANGVHRPIIFMSGSLDASLREQAIELGCIAFLQKPFAASLLNTAIAKAVGRSLTD